MISSYLNRVHQGDIVQMLDQIYEDCGPCVDLIFTDPPYNLEKSYEGYADDMRDKDYIEWCNQWLEGYAKLLKPTGSLFILNLPKWSTHHAVFLNSHLYFQNWIIWDALSDPRGKMMPAHYTLLHYTSSATDFTLNPVDPVEPAGRCLRPKCIKGRDSRHAKENLTNIWHDVHRIKHKRDRDDHPCQLPEKLLERVLRLSSNPGDIVLDGFMGTGTTAVVAAKMGRKFIGIENDPSYVAIANERLININRPRMSIPRQPALQGLD